jgi:hypothetical protein
MNRNQYIEMVKANKFDVSLIYEYYNIFNENKSFTFDLNTFNEILMQYIGFAGFNVDIVKDYYDAKFNVTYLYDKNQKIINIY